MKSGNYEKNKRLNRAIETDLIAEVQKLRMENEYLKAFISLNSPNSMNKSERISVIDELRHKYKLSDLLAFDGMPKSTFYYNLKKMKKPDKYSDEKEIIHQIFHENKGRYGYRRITMELRNRGYSLNHKTVQKLMKQCELKCAVKRKQYCSYKGEIGKIAPNRLEQNFSATKPNQKWVTDITEFSVQNKKVYLSSILDLYNGEVISYNISLNPTFHQTMDMLEKAFKTIPDNTGLILHSDQGWQYQMKRYQLKLHEKGIIQSMSRKGNCLDNAVMENFFGLLKAEMFYPKKFKSTEDLIQEIEEYIDYYNNRRIKYKLKGLSPVQYRIQSLQIA